VNTASILNEGEPVDTGSINKPISLANCMAEFTKEELLDGNDQMYCSKCKSHCPTKKQLSVYTLPEVNDKKLTLDSGDSIEAIFKRRKIQL
jgi:hypothetical protein